MLSNSDMTISRVHDTFKGMIDEDVIKKFLGHSPRSNMFRLAELELISRKYSPTTILLNYQKFLEENTHHD